uniref:Uncharacterized protein n=1 Tax=Romanomermis culicivorax TaxID=13658 RepID=A0A915HFG4_ROMCU
MLETGSGHIVSICSVAAYMGLAYSRAYSSSKSGQRGFMQALNHELKTCNKSSNIKTTTIYPSFVDTPLLKNLTPSSSFL